MTFAALSPLLLIVAAVATAAVVFALHMLRRTPRAQTVSNVDFWRRAAERSRPRSLLATRVPWIAMLLCLAIALLIVGEMGDPRTGSGYSGTTVIVLDADRTMGARDEHGRRRMDDALALVRQTVQADTITGQVAVVRAGVHPEVVVPLTHRGADAERGLQRVETDDGTADLSAAIAIARGIVRGARSEGRIVVVADRDDFARTSDAAVPVVLMGVGTPGETLAVAAFDARRDPMALGEYYVRVEIRSYSAHPARARLVVRDRDVVISDEHVTLGPGDVTTHRAHGFSSAQGELSARLEDIEIDGGRDALAGDDVAFATVPPVVASRVLLVTRGNRFLQNALAANPAVELATVDPAGLAARRGDLSRFQVVVLDRVAPVPPLDHPAQLIVGVGDSRVVRLGQEIQSPRVTAYAAEHRILAGLRFDQLQITRARAIVPDADDRVLVRSGRDALAIARDRDGSRVIALGFDTESTDLVQRIAFPLFMHNALVWLDRRERD
ncbi:MAG: VWA domain-containing protein, partial [Deltaproteobacteria bacterium]